MPQITVIPRQHWNFKAIPQDIDVVRILKEASAAGESVVRIRVRFIDGIRTYLFVLSTSDDAEAIPSVFRAELSQEMAFTTTKNIKYTPMGFTSDPTEEDLTWIVISREHIIDQAIRRIYKQ